MENVKPGKLSGGAGPLVQVDLPESYDNEFEWEQWHEQYESHPIDEDFIETVNKFSYKTAAQVLNSENRVNLNYSPSSLYFALALAASGAEGETRQELLDILGVDSMEYLETQCRNLFTVSYTVEDTGISIISNSLWVDDSLTIKQSFAEKTAENFFASAHYGDFADPKLGKEMSDWVSDSTKGMLKPEFEFSEKDIFSIINAVYFSSEWVDEFYKDRNTQGDFHLADGSTVTAEYMHSENQGGFNRGENFVRSTRNLKHGSMFFVLPDEGVPVSELYKDEAALAEACSGGEELFGDVTWQMPKFSFDSDITLRDTVKALGAETMFSDKADFSAISNSQLFVSNIRQGSKIAVDEKGVEAAAFTEILYCGAALTEERADMILDRPFLYGVKDETGNIMFIGVCGDPNSQE